MMEESQDPSVVSFNNRFYDTVFSSISSTDRLHFAPMTGMGFKNPNLYL